jgi:hypothetical protein
MGSVLMGKPEEETTRETRHKWGILLKWIIEK